MKNQESPRVTIGIISYKDKSYLEQALPSLLKQNYDNYEVLLCDNTPDLEVLPWVEKEFPEIIGLSNGGNIGFGRAHNFMMQKAIEKGSKYYLCFNSDMFASSSFVSDLVKFFEEYENKSAEKKLACVSPKLLQWKNFPSSPLEIKENTYDTTGLVAKFGNMFMERGGSQADDGRYRDKTRIWGASGASPMFLLEALQDIEYEEGEFFDSNYFMYKEDIDLSYRLRWAGYEILYASQAVAWHDRTGEDPGTFLNQIIERRRRPLYIKENSFLNHLQTVYKNWSKDFSCKMKAKTYFSLFKYFVYLLVFDTKILRKYLDFRKLKPELKLRRDKMPRRISAREMEKLFV